VRARAFEPFFTTKGPGRGSGLGLAQIHGFAHQSGGTVTIDSAPGQGTEVTLLLPRTAAAEPLRDPESLEAAALPRGCGETVLVVEDDTAVRATLAATLRNLGYRVLEAGVADTGLATLASTGTVDAVLTDLTMPGPLDGLEFAAIARTRRPDLPVVLVTAHPDPLHGRQLPEGVALLLKPFDRARIATVLRNMLDRKTPLIAA
jgi:CheY-like chemotaxis protein